MKEYKKQKTQTCSCPSEQKVIVRKENSRRRWVTAQVWFKRILHLIKHPFRRWSFKMSRLLVKCCFYVIESCEQHGTRCARKDDMWLSCQPFRWNIWFSQSDGKCYFTSKLRLQVVQQQEACTQKPTHLLKGSDCVVSLLNPLAIYYKKQTNLQVVLFKAQCAHKKHSEWRVEIDGEEAAMLCDHVSPVVVDSQLSGITLYMINRFSFICLQYVLLTFSATKSHSRRVKAAVFWRSVELWDNSLHNELDNYLRWSLGWRIKIWKWF